MIAFLLSALGIVRGVWNWLFKQDWRIIAVAALALFAAYQWHLASSRQASLESAKRANATLTMALKTTTESVRIALAKIKEQNAAIDGLARAGEKARVAAQDARRKAQDDNRASLDLARRLVATAAPAAGCRTPKDVLGAGL